MEACFEYLGCDKRDCIQHGRRDNKRCREVDGTLCNHQGIDAIQRKTDGPKEMACVRAGCIYHKAAKDQA